MRSFLSLTTKAMRCFHVRALFALALAMSVSLAVIAQQPAVGRKRVPRLTDDDVRPPAAEPAVEPTKESTPSKPEDAAKTQPAMQPSETKISPEESSWRERLAKARERAKELDREADETELRITDLRNQLGVSGQTPKDRNLTAAEMERTGQELAELRKQARAAADEVNQLLEHGRAHNYREDEGPKAVQANGKPNADYYHGRHAKLKEDIATAERRVEMYENRVRDLSQRILMNGGKDGGDNFYMIQLQQERQNAQQKMEEAREARDKAQTELDALVEEARRAGVQLK